MSSTHPIAKAQRLVASSPAQRWWPWTALVSALLPALSRWALSALPGGPDQAIHVFRAVELDWALANGVWYPRWAADLVYGFGYPLFNVYGPATQYLIVGLHRLGLSFVTATLTAFALADLVAGAGAFVFGRALFGVRAGWLTALAYVYSPYVLMSLQRGALPEAWGLALLPWLLWSVWALHRAPGFGALARTAALFAALPFIHNPSTALAGGCVGGLVVALTFAAPPGRRLRPALAVVGALALALAVSAWYWVPVVFEVQTIHIERAYSPPVLDFHYHFLPFNEVFSWPQPFDRSLIGAQVSRALGWLQVALAAAALVGLGRWPRDRRAILGAAAAGAAVLIGLTQADAVLVWERLPGLSLIQFPARLLGPASLLLAVVAGSVAPASAAAAPKRAHWLAPLAAVGLVLYALPWTYIGLDPSVSPNPSLVEIHDWERRTGTIGTTTAGEYLPIWVNELPDPETLREAYVAGAPVARLAVDSLPAGARIASQAAGYTRHQVDLETPVGFTAVFNVFYFPGWHATVNDVEAVLTPTTPHGLISLEVPAGRATIDLDFGATLPRQIGGAVSVIGLALLAAEAWRGRRGSAAPRSTEKLSWDVAALAVVGLALLGVRFAGQGGDTPFAHTRLVDGAVVDVQQPRALDIGGALQLLGLEQSATEIPADGSVNLALYWRVLQAERPDYSVQVSLRDAAGSMFGQSDAQHPAEHPTSRWQLNDYARDQHALTPYPGTPPGTYALMTTVYRQADGFQLAAPVAVGSVTITCPSVPPTLDPLKRFDAAFGPVTFVGVDWVDPTLDAGATLSFTAHWMPIAAPGQDLQARLQLFDHSGVLAAERIVPPIRDDYPTTDWQPNCPLRAPIRIRIPAELQGGRYTVRLTLLDGDRPTQEADVTLGTVVVREPMRSYTPPAFEHAAGVEFGDVAELVGWTLTSDQVTLVWRALGANAQDYTVFVHALAPDDTILVQSDSPPAGGARATTTWVAGEYIVDPHALALNGEPVRLRIGLYEPSTGARLTTDAGAEFVILTAEPR